VFLFTAHSLIAPTHGEIYIFYSPHYSGRENKYNEFFVKKFSCFQLPPVPKENIPSLKIFIGPLKNMVQFYLIAFKVLLKTVCI